MNRTDNRRIWREYLATCSTLGTFENRSPEYGLVWDGLTAYGVSDQDLIVDVGCGDQGLDWYIRKAGFRGQYLGVDGSIEGDDLNVWVPRCPAEWFVSIETVEHLEEPLRLIETMIAHAIKGVFVTTPNPAVVDVGAVDPSHCSEVSEADLDKLGFATATVEFNSRGAGDTLVGWWLGEGAIDMNPGGT